MKINLRIMFVITAALFMGCTVEEPKWVGWMRELQTTIDEYGATASAHPEVLLPGANSTNAADISKKLDALRGKILKMLAEYNEIIKTVSPEHQEKFKNGYDLMALSAENTLYPWRRWLSYYSKITYAVVATANHPEIKDQFDAAYQEWNYLEGVIAAIEETIPAVDKPFFLASVQSNRDAVKDVIKQK
ncbi:MAG: hypothetical protein A2014_11350 [Spirochaetes bacterium GWF1_49_6]|nr:MAG: hypothetical protein A2014_11350 [Spirochaetes bacterium GWF1_49_6]